MEVEVVVIRMVIKLRSNFKISTSFLVHIKSIVVGTFLFIYTFRLWDATGKESLDLRWTWFSSLSICIAKNSLKAAFLGEEYVDLRILYFFFYVKISTSYEKVSNLRILKNDDLKWPIYGSTLEWDTLKRWHKSF